MVIRAFVMYKNHPSCKACKFQQNLSYIAFAATTSSTTTTTAATTLSGAMTNTTTAGASEYS